MSDFAIEEFIERLKDRDPEVRLYAAWALGRHRDPRSIGPLIQALNDEDSTVRVRVAESLGNLRDERAVQPLIEALKDDEEKVRAQAAAALGRQRNQQAVDGLLQCLQNDDRAPVRNAAIAALGELHDQSAIEPLIAILFDDTEEEDTLYHAAKSLKNLGGEATAEAILPWLEANPSATAKRYSAEIFAALYSQNAVEMLRTLVQDEDELVQETAKWALKKLGAD